jgi:apolipoprotein N-acyltransferase
LIRALASGLSGPLGSRPALRDLALLLLGALLWAAYARGAWVLGFVALLPWLALLRRRRRWPAELGWALAFALVFSAAVFGWFGQAMGRYSGIGAAAGQGVLLLLAPLFQPQWLAWVLVRQGVARLRGPGWGALAGACAWVGLEWAWPKLLGDSLGHGLYPSEALRPLAAWGGVAGLTLLLLGVNEALSAAWRTGRWRLAAAGLAAPLLLVRSNTTAWTRCCGRRPSIRRPSATRAARTARRSTARSSISSQLPACRWCSAPTMSMAPASTTRPPSSNRRPACSATTARPTRSR